MYNGYHKDIRSKHTSLGHNIYDMHHISYMIAIAECVSV